MAENRAWKKLPDEEGYWLRWNADKQPLMCMYFVAANLAQGGRYYAPGLGLWCDEMGGYWLKGEVPTPPTAVERADAEAAWLKRFEKVMKADTERVVEDTKIEGEKHEPA